MRHPILIVEDDVPIREGLAEILSRDGFDVVEAGNGLECLRAAHERRPRLMLLDLLMPVMDGWEFRAEQLKNPDIADIPVIVMSAADVDFETLHAAASFPKPFRVAELLDEVRARDAGA